MEVNTAIMKIFQSFFSFLFLDTNNRSREIDFLAFYFLPFQASLILAKLQSDKITLLPSSQFHFGIFTQVLGFFFPKEWGKENAKENIPKMILSFIHAIVLGVQKCWCWWKGAFKKTQSKKKKIKHKRNVFF